MDQHQFVQQWDNLREKHVPLGDATAHSASPQQEGQLTCHEAAEMLLLIPPLAKDSQAVLLSSILLLHLCPITIQPL